MLSNTVITFRCQAIGVDVTWFINDVRMDRNTSEYTVVFMISESLYTTLTTTATSENNNTKIKCHASGTTSGQFDEEVGNIVVAGTQGG